jgi:spore coat polysaccharide biosynthesis protein SpsF
VKIVALIQTRLGSKRLPNKALLVLRGKPIIWHIYNRLQHAKLVNQVVISTGQFEKNKEICELASRYKISYYAGSELDLIDRLYKTALNFEADAIVRITGDNPLVDPTIVDKLVSEFVQKNDRFDIVTNSRKKTFPHGLDVEIYSVKILKKLWNEIKDPSLREWFTTYIDKNNANFRILNVEHTENLTDFRWTLDYEEDYEFIKEIYENLYLENKIFVMQDILKLLEQKPELSSINSKYVDHHNIGSPL